MAAHSLALSAIDTTPGEWISNETAGGVNPGAGYVRFALVPGIEQTRQAAERIRAATW